MAHHNSTPESVLTAPSALTWTAFRPDELTRPERRRLGARTPNVHGTNETYVRTAPRRGKRVKRHRDVLQDFVEVPRPE